MIKVSSYQVTTSSQVANSKHTSPTSFRGQNFLGRSFSEHLATKTQPKFNSKIAGSQHTILQPRVLGI